jgi:hypothetical protein
LSGKSGKPSGPTHSGSRKIRLRPFCIQIQ